MFLDAVPQYAIITDIDKLLPENGKLENVYTYKSVKELCEKVRDSLGITLGCIFPVSNYYEELTPNDAKNAMSLMAIWNATVNGQSYMKNKRLSEEI